MQPLGPDQLVDELGNMLAAVGLEDELAQADARQRCSIEHRLTKPNHPWTNGQVERINRTIEDATVKCYHYGSHNELRRHLLLFIDAYNHGHRLKTLRGLSPCEYVARARTEDPRRFKNDSYRHTSGLNTWSRPFCGA